MKIMKNCILNYLKDKTIILVTHAFQYISFANKIIYMNKRKIKWIRRYNEMKEQKLSLKNETKKRKIEKI